VTKSATKYVIVNADDFGQSPGINRGIVTAHEHGIVTSASLMVRWPAATAAGAYARAHPQLSVGLHLDLGEWVCREGRWLPAYEVVATEDAAAVATEVDRQLAAFRDIVGRDPTHIDSHQHAHLEEPVRSIVLAVGRRLHVPVRRCDAVIRYCGDFYGQTDEGDPCPEILSMAGLLRVLNGLSPGVTELGCHPGDASDLDTMYRDERLLEIRVLCDPRVRAALPSLGLQLCAYSNLPPFH
jgi:predicted glycoside hydrolase/deacetylase ChbG (UPF0249 family)